MILLDTHTWIWAHSETHLLSANVLELIQETRPDQRAIASISIWEFAMMASKGRIVLKIDPKIWLSSATTMSGLRILELTADVAMESCSLPGEFHRDPADRIIGEFPRNNLLIISSIMLP